MNKNLTAMVLIVLAIGIYFTVTTGIIDEGKIIVEENKKYLAAIDNLDKLLKLRDEVKEKYNALPAEDKTNLDKMIPSTVDNVRLMIDLNEKIAFNHGFTLKNLKAEVSDASNDPTAPPVVAGETYMAPTAVKISNPKLDTVRVSFSVTAPYLQFINFMKDLESNMRIMDLTKLSMTASDTGIYDFNVELKTYWMRQ